MGGRKKTVKFQDSSYIEKNEDQPIPENYKISALDPKNPYKNTPSRTGTLNLSKSAMILEPFLTKKVEPVKEQAYANQTPSVMDWLAMKK